MRAANRPSVPKDLACRTLRARGSELALLSFTPSGNGRLTRAECDVAVAVARGLSNAAIAKERGASVRTIANQVAAIMKKLAATSRVEIATKLDVSDLT